MQLLQNYEFTNDTRRYVSCTSGGAWYDIPERLLLEDGKIFVHGNSLIWRPSRRFTLAPSCPVKGLRDLVRNPNRYGWTCAVEPAPLGFFSGLESYYHSPLNQAEYDSSYELSLDFTRKKAQLVKIIETAPVVVLTYNHATMLKSLKEED